MQVWPRWLGKRGSGASKGGTSGYRWATQRCVNYLLFTKEGKSGYMEYQNKIKRSINWKMTINCCTNYRETDTKFMLNTFRFMVSLFRFVIDLYRYKCDINEQNVLYFDKLSSTQEVNLCWLCIVFISRNNILFYIFVYYNTFEMHKKYWLFVITLHISPQTHWKHKV